MSGLAKVYADVMQKQIDAFAAWFPVTNTLEVGDFGLFEDGIFKPMGKLKHRFPDIVIRTEPGPATEIDFKSDGTKSVMTNVGGSADFNSAIGEAEAELTISFTRENSCILKAKLTSIQMTNIDEVAKALLKQKSWEKRFKVVSAVYIGEKGTVMLSLKAGTEIKLKGKVEILKQVEAGKAEAGLQIVSNNSSVFHSVGEKGVLGIDLFKFNLLGKAKVMGDLPEFKIEKIESQKIEDIENDIE